MSAGSGGASTGPDNKVFKRSGLMKRCLVTGATGLIGRHVVRLLGDNWDRYALIRKRRAKGLGSIHYIGRDLARDWNLVGLPKRVDAVIHLAQSEYFREFPVNAEPMFRVNTASTLRLLEYARKAGATSFVFASSGGIYGHGDEEFRENGPILLSEAIGFYLSTKVCSEILTESYTAYMNVIILRFFFVYGPGQRATMLIPRLVRAVREKQPIILHGKDGLKLNPTYVTDAASAVCSSLELTGNHTINIGGPEVLSLRQIALHVGNVLKKDPVFKMNDHIPPQHLVGNIKRMTDLLGEPVVTFGEGIVRYIEGRDEE